MSSTFLLPEDGCGFQPKHVGTIKPIVQLVGERLVCTAFGPESISSALE
jgi:hypothetical protein